MGLTLALVESALQLVPPKIQSHPQIRRYAERRRKQAGEVLLDRAFHHAAMRSLANRRSSLYPEKMGRPDIVHNTLLQILETPLSWEGQLRVLIHTQEDKIITVNPKVRLPKNYLRFMGLVEQLFAEKKVPAEGEPLLTMQNGNIHDLIHLAEPTRTIGFSKLGKPTLLKDVADHSSKLKSPLALVGAFPRGHFTAETRQAIDELYRIDRDSLDAWVVAGRFVYDFERSIGLSKSRLEPT